MCVLYHFTELYSITHNIKSYNISNDTISIKSKNNLLLKFHNNNNNNNIMIQDTNWEGIYRQSIYSVIPYMAIEKTEQIFSQLITRQRESSINNILN